MAGAILQRPLGAQVRDTIPKKRDTTLTIPAPARADSMLRDSLAKKDSIERARIRGDTIKSPMAQSELPINVDIGRNLRWNRDALFASGVIDAADLLERVQGLTTLHTGWVSSPVVGAYLGDPRRVRVFFDGVELTPLDPRHNGTLDLTQINLWAAQEVVVEQAPEEVRVYIRSWTVRSTTPATRTDIATGDQQTNLYRGFYGQRLRNGLALQFAAQQYGTTPPSLYGTGSDQLGVIARVGWSNGLWSVDGFMTRISRHRGNIVGLEQGDAIPALESTRSESYVRFAYREVDASPFWGQFTAVAGKYDYTGIRTVPTTNLRTARDSALAIASLDTGVFQPQYIATVGSASGPFRVSGGVRMSASRGESVIAPTARASFARGALSVSAFGEGKGLDSTARVDVTGELSPLSFIALLGGVGRVSDGHQVNGFSANYARAQVGLRVKNLWLLGGVVRRDSVTVAAPRVFDTLLVSHREPAANGVTAGIRGQLWRLINADISAIRWNDSVGSYRPRYQTRSELWLQTSLLDKFPSGNLGIKASIVHEYRSRARFPTLDGTVRTASDYRTFSTLLEVRILSATLSWQFRNFLGERYTQVPSYLMPRQTNFYGVRWYFFD